MRRRAQWTLIGLACMAVVSYAGPGIPPVTDPTQRLEFPGFSILPPQGENWVITHKATHGVAIDKVRPLPSLIGQIVHTFGVIVITGRETETQMTMTIRVVLAEEILKVGGRFRLVGYELVEDSTFGADCARINRVIEERDNPRFPGSVLVVTRRELYCRHPYSRGLFIRAGYSERYLQGHEPKPPLMETLKHEVEPFLKSIVFTPVR